MSGKKNQLQINTDGNGLPEGWEWKKLGEVCNFDKNRGSYTKPYVGLEDIESNTAKFIGSPYFRKVKSITFLFNDSHILYGRLRPYLNKVLVPDFEGHCSTEIFPIKVSNVIDRTFLATWFMLDSTVYKINSTCTGSRMPRANMKEVLNFKIPLPPLAEQKRIVAILDEAFATIDKAKANAEKNLANAQELFESYLNGIFADPGEDWEEYELNKHVKFIDYRGRTPKKTKSGIRLITAKNIKKGYIQREPEEYIAIDNYDSWMTRGVPVKGDILFTTEAPLANVAQLDTSEKVAFAQRTIIFQPDSKVLNKKFLKYLLLSKPIQDKIFAEGTGATVKGIKSRLLKKIKITFPGIQEQLSIEVHLDKLSAKSKQLESIYQQKLTALDELKKSILKKAFEGEL